MEIDNRDNRLVIRYELKYSGDKIYTEKFRISMSDYGILLATIDEKVGRKLRDENSIRKGIITLTSLEEYLEFMKGLEKQDMKYSKTGEYLDLYFPEKKEEYVCVSHALTERRQREISDLARDEVEEISKEHSDDLEETRTNMRLSKTVLKSYLK